MRPLTDHYAAVLFCFSVVFFFFFARSSITAIKVARVVVVVVVVEVFGRGRVFYWNFLSNEKRDMRTATTRRFFSVAFGFFFQLFAETERADRKTTRIDNDGTFQRFSLSLSLSLSPSLFFFVVSSAF